VRDGFAAAAERAQGGPDVELGAADPFRVTQALEDRELTLEQVERRRVLTAHPARRSDRAQDPADRAMSEAASASRCARSSQGSASVGRPWKRSTFPSPSRARIRVSGSFVASPTRRASP
jgi:hypothetical protein